MKKFIRNIIHKLGYDLKKIDKEFSNPSLEDILKKKNK